MSRTLYFLSGRFYRLTLSTCQGKQYSRRSISDSGKKTTVISGRWRRFWCSWMPISTSVGVTVLAVLQWRRIQKDQRIASPWEINVYRALPNRALSRAWGWVTNCQVPRPLRPTVFGLYSSLCGVNLDEMEKDIQDYPSLASFFTRALKEGCRPIDSSKCIVSPADGTVLNCGEIDTDCVQQIKGATYKIQVFLGEPSFKYNKSSQKSTLKKETDENDNEIDDAVEKNAESKAVQTFSKLFRRKKEEPCEVWEDYKLKLLRDPKNELYQFIVYLAPGDYHRFHSPVQWNVKYRRHFQGELLSVNPIIAGWVPELFSLNERVVYMGEWEHGFFSFTAVGATNVGSIKVHCDESLETNTKKWKDGVRHKDKALEATWEKGEEVGEFRMGSTIVLIFEAPKDFVFDVKQHQRVMVGESVLKAEK